MALTRDFKETVQARAQRDPAFREGLLKEGVECLLAGDVDAGKIVLRDYINATIGFEELGSLTNKPPKSLMRMFGPDRQSPRPQSLRGHQSHSAARGHPTRSEGRSIVGLSSFGPAYSPRRNLTNAQRSSSDRRYLKAGMGEFDGWPASIRA